MVENFSLPNSATRTEAVTLPCFVTRLGLFDGGCETLSVALLGIKLATFSWKRSMLIDYVSALSSVIIRDVNNMTKKGTMMQIISLVRDNW
jgi:hypothetical protein